MAARARISVVAPRSKFLWLLQILRDLCFRKIRFAVVDPFLGESQTLPFCIFWCFKAFFQQDSLHQLRAAFARTEN